MQKHISRRLLLSATILGTAGIAFGSFFRLPQAPSYQRNPRLLQVQRFGDLVALSNTLAAEPYQPPQETRSAKLRNLTPREFAEISFNPERALWRNTSSYEAHFFPPGVYATDLIEIFEKSKNTESAFTPVQSRSDMFLTQAQSKKVSTEDIDGLSGLKLLYPLDPQKGWKDELVVFLGASYFRFLGKNQQYGLSARGIAIDTALPKDEEFPLFRAMWLQEPAAGDHSVEVWALLDGPSICGAYRFTITPGEETFVDVDATISLRREVEKLGIAPLTSMFLNGENEKTKNPAVFSKHIHDSDGMMLALGSEDSIVWRPLAKRQGVVITQHFDVNPKGFGLLQRFQDEASFATPEKRYHLRPGYWVEPLTNWGEGHVQLVEIASDDVDFDNLALFWVPNSPPKPGDPARYQYRITSMRRAPHSRPAFGIVKHGQVMRLDRPTPKPYLKIEIKFSEIPETVMLSDLTTDVSSFHGVPENIRIERESPYDLVLSFDLQSEDPERADMRATLLAQGKPISETWSYLWTP